MNQGTTIFTQLLDYLPKEEFRRCVERYSGSYKVQSFSCWNQFLAMAFAQLTYRESLRDIEACLHSQTSKLYNMGFRSRVTRSTLSHANTTRDWRIYRDFAQVLINSAHALYRDEPFDVELSNTVYAFDSTTIDLCLSLFPWATFRKHKAAVKLHTLLNLRGNIPSFLSVSRGNVHDVNLLDELLLEPGSVYVLDKAYMDFKRLYLFTQSFAYFVTRAKSNLRFNRIYSHPVDRSCGTRCDQTIRLSGFHSAQQYPERLRRIKYYDTDTERSFIFLTNNFLLPSLIPPSAGLNSTSAVGKLSFSSNGSSSIFGSKRSTVHQTMPYAHKSGSPFQSMSWLPFSRSVSTSIIAFTQFYRS